MSRSRLQTFHFTCDLMEQVAPHVLGPNNSNTHRSSGASWAKSFQKASTVHSGSDPSISVFCQCDRPSKSPGGWAAANDPCRGALHERIGVPWCTCSPLTLWTQNHPELCGCGSSRRHRRVMAPGDRSSTTIPFSNVSVGKRS